jgi:hypothetical protein
MLSEAVLLFLLPAMGLDSSGFCMPPCLLLHSEILFNQLIISMKILLTTISCFLALSLFGQGILKPAELVQAEKSKGMPFQTVTAFDQSEGRANLGEETPEQYDLLEMRDEVVQQLHAEQPDRITFTLPSTHRSELAIELVKVDLFTDDFQVTDSQTESAADVDYGVHYRGIIKGESGSIASLSVFEDGIMGLFSPSRGGNLVLGQLEGNRNETRYILYNDKDVLERMAYDCGTPDDGEGYTREELQPQAGTRALSDCVRLYYEVDYDIFQSKGGTQGATNYVTGIANEVATLYANENINTVVSEIFVWSSTSPYSSSSSSGMLSDFQSYRNGVNGDLGHLLSYQASGGIAAGFSGLCNSNPDNSLCFSSINSSYSQVPTYSFTIMVTTHEFGHLFGSRHTHACVWNGNNTAIDGCAGSTEGSCSLPGYPSNGGTIMSYCHVQSVGINFNLGFGPQPGNVIRNRVSNASCLQACDGGGGNPACNDNEVTLTINLDNYPGETTWSVVNGSGTTVASGGPYSGAGSTVTEDICLPNGCYDFTIFDSYGDGICCGYGNGSYSLTDGSTVLASGGSFTNSETTNFCVSNAPPPPISYCGSEGNNSNFEWIQRIQFGSINNNSGNDGGYGDYTNLSTALTPGGSVSVTLVPGFSSSTYTEYWRLWIDYNRDGDFSDAGEQIGQGSGTGTLSGTLSVSSSATPGTTRMRVAMKYNAYAAPCETFSYGEVEDYTVTIGAALPGENGIAVADVTGLESNDLTKGAGFRIFPNPAKDLVNLQYRAAVEGKVEIELLDLMGRTLQAFTDQAVSGSNAFQLETSQLPEGTYLIRLTQNDQQHVERAVISR